MLKKKNKNQEVKIRSNQIELRKNFMYSMKFKNYVKWDFMEWLI